MFGSGEEISPWGWQAGEVWLFIGPIESLHLSRGGIRYHLRPETLRFSHYYRVGMS